MVRKEEKRRGDSTKAPSLAHPASPVPARSVPCQSPPPCAPCCLCGGVCRVCVWREKFLLHEWR